MKMYINEQNHIDYFSTRHQRSWHNG